MVPLCANRAARRSRKLSPRRAPKVFSPPPALSLLVQKAKYSLRAHVFRFTPESGLKSDIARCLKRAKVRRTQHEHMSSGLPLKADIARCSWHVANVPIPLVVRFIRPARQRFVAQPYRADQAAPQRGRILVSER